MGERILREDGLDVIAVTDGAAALERMAEIDPDLVLVDAFLPTRSGYEICQYVKNHPRFPHTRVVLTAGLLEPLDEDRARRVGSDAVLKKPFEASVVIETLKPLLVKAREARKTLQPDRPPASVATGRSGAAAAPALVNRAWTGRPANALMAPPPPLAAVPVQAAAQSPVPSAVTGEIDPERVRAAVTIALDAALPRMIDEITERVLTALSRR
jgi:CheY-like chemotaxis protein